MVKTLPTIEELKAGIIPQPGTLEALLETEPPKEWLRPHPTAKNDDGTPVLYIPIKRINQLLRDIYAASWLDVLSVDKGQNTVIISVRLFTINPVTGKTEHEDGVGAAESKRGFEAALAIAKTNAKKNAAKEKGKIFGRDLSRDEPEPAKTEEPAVTQDEGSEIYAGLAVKLRQANTSFKLQQVNRAIQERFVEGDLEEFELDKLKAIADEMAATKKPAVKRTRKKKTNE